MKTAETNRQKPITEEPTRPEAVKGEQAAGKISGKNNGKME